MQLSHHSLENLSLTADFGRSKMVMYSMVMFAYFRTIKLTMVTGYLATGSLCKFLCLASFCCSELRSIGDI